MIETGAGAFVTPSLTGQAASASLNGNNAVGVLDNVRLPGGFSLNDTQSLVLNGLSAQNVTLNVAGAIAQTQPLVAASLAGSADSVLLTGANQVGRLAELLRARQLRSDEYRVSDSHRDTEQGDGQLARDRAASRRGHCH